MGDGKLRTGARFFCVDCLEFGHFACGRVGVGKVSGAGDKGRRGMECSDV